MLELEQVCEEGKHRFAFNGENEMDICPYCKTSVSLQPDTANWEEKFGKKLKHGIDKKLSRGKIIDSLPRLPWFGDAVDENLNDPDQKRAHEVWSLGDAKELAALFEKHGISTHALWYKVSESIGRSLYAVERQLRVVIANRDYDLYSFFPGAV